jgi:hypothetical protein
MGISRRIYRPSTSVLSVGIVGILVAGAYAGYRSKTRFDGTENYGIAFPTSFPGWKSMPKTPESLFIFENPKKHFLLRGSVSQVIADVNPTPNDTTDSMAEFYIDRTHENMPDWTASRAADLPGSNVRFSVIQRQRKQHAVITAFTVKGNTTLMISISTQSGGPASVADAMTELGSYLKGVSLNLKDMGGGRKAVTDSNGRPVSLN